MSEHTIQMIESALKEGGSIICLLTGVTFEGRQIQLSKLQKKGNFPLTLHLKAEPENSWDKYALKVLTEKNIEIGYIPKKTAQVGIEGGASTVPPRIQVEKLNKILGEISPVTSYLVSLVTVLGGNGYNYSARVRISLKE